MAARSDGLSLEMSRVVPAERELAFEFFADSSKLARWWGPRGFSTPSMEFDPRVGAGYRIEMQPPGGDAFHLAGEFRAVERPARLAFTFRWEPPDPDDVETVVDLAFHDLGEATEVVLEQGPFKTDARRELHRNGWTESLDRLEDLLARGDQLR